MGTKKGPETGYQKGAQKWAPKKGPKMGTEKGPTNWYQKGAREWVPKRAKNGHPKQIIFWDARCKKKQRMAGCVGGRGKVGGCVALEWDLELDLYCLALA